MAVQEGRRRCLDDPQHYIYLLLLKTMPCNLEKKEDILPHGTPLGVNKEYVHNHSSEQWRIQKFKNGQHFGKVAWFYLEGKANQNKIS
ncbi:hypothetical protein V6N13_004685 [Hibiscus sabdariffa]|uniref:NAC domain-containing protein n=1 Tax=Hibiscus sabdariffa TaxID=183260 RepID=A0ABR2RZ95_9ROSI